MEMTIETPSVTDLPDIIDAVASWQHDDQPIQVHPGDLGWYQRFGAEALASALRVWTQNGETVAIGFLDESELIRMAVSPAHAHDQTIAEAVVTDLVGALSEFLPAGKGVVECRFGPALRHTLAEAGWIPDEPWTQLRRDLTTASPSGSLRIEIVSADRVGDRVAVGSAAFPGSSLTRERWHLMAVGHAYRLARCLIGYTEAGQAAGATTVWSAGRGRPGLIEPLGVGRAHQGHGYGVEMAHAAASTLRAMGASSVTVATPSSNTAAVAAYRAAGMNSFGEVTDFRRP